MGEALAEDLNRLRRALAVADLLQAMGFKSAECQLATEDDRKKTAALLAMAEGEPNSKYVPSEETWRQAVIQLCNREAAAEWVEQQRKVT